MSFLYHNLIRPILFRMDPEQIHELTLRWLGRLARCSVCRKAAKSFFGGEELPVEAMGLRFPNPVGLAAGMDKEAAALPMWEAMGFGHVELGAVTRLPQPGNPKPRVFRIPAREAIVNRMGFNNPGAEAFARRLEAWRAAGAWPRHPVGVNLGKSRVTPLAEAAEDYRRSFARLRDLADFFVVNVSSPNTPGLRRLQDRQALEEILQALAEENRREKGRPPKPVLVKVAPDLSESALEEAAAAAVAGGAAGLVATNTATARPEESDPAVARAYREEGGLSGRPLAQRSTEVIRFLHRLLGGKLPIIGVGGIFSAEDAWEKARAGATLLQVYTGFVYEGPGLPSRIVRGLRERLQREGARRWEEIVGGAA